MHTRNKKRDADASLEYFLIKDKGIIDRVQPLLPAEHDMHLLTFRSAEQESSWDLS